MKFREFASFLLPECFSRSFDFKEHLGARKRRIHMYQWLARLMLIAALAQLGLSLKSVGNYRSIQCVRQIQRASLEVLKIDWKPISVWPEEARRFK